MKQFFTLFLCLLLAASAAGQELMRVQDPSRKYGFIDQQGNTVSPCKYDDAGVPSEGLVSVELDGKMGYGLQVPVVIEAHYYNGKLYGYLYTFTNNAGEYHYMRNQYERLAKSE